jgi:riboflavin kinase / FMN adenylyltransferase
VQVLRDADPRWPSTQRSVVTIGAYDGLHSGHRAVIDLVRSEAIQRDAQSVVVTFDRHPASVVRPESAPKLLTDAEQKIELLGATGLDATYLVHFDERRAKESPEDFVREVLVDRLHASAIVVGEDFHFGHHRSGDVTMLRQLGARLGFEVLPLELLPRSDGPQEPVSSTAIRRALAGGQVEIAAKMLGRPYEVRGIVAKGDQRGRTLGFPTANVIVPDVMCVPADGVYAGWYVRPGGERHRCAVNIGRRPTFYEHADVSLLEAHLIDFDGDLYGETARVEFHTFLRSERKFNGIDSLISQLKSDVDAARTID